MTELCHKTILACISALEEREKTIVPTPGYTDGYQACHRLSIDELSSLLTPSQRLAILVETLISPFAVQGIDFASCGNQTIVTFNPPSDRPQPTIEAIRKALCDADLFITDASRPLIGDDRWVKFHIANVKPMTVVEARSLADATHQLIMAGHWATATPNAYNAVAALRSFTHYPPPDFVKNPDFALAVIRRGFKVIREAARAINNGTLNASDLCDFSAMIEAAGREKPPMTEAEINAAIIKAHPWTARYLEETDEEGYVPFNFDRRLGQNQYASRYIEGNHGYAYLGQGYRFKHLETGSYHDIRIHKSDLAQFHQRVLTYKDC